MAIPLEVFSLDRIVSTAIRLGVQALGGMTTLS